MNTSNIVETDLTQITNIMELKAHKADQYDILENANRQMRIAEMNIQAINTRIAQLQSQQEVESRACGERRSELVNHLVV